MILRDYWLMVKCALDSFGKKEFLKTMKIGVGYAVACLVLATSGNFVIESNLDFGTGLLNAAEILGLATIIIFGGSLFMLVYHWKDNWFTQEIKL